MLTTYLVDSSHLQSFPNLGLFLFFRTHHHARRDPLRHDTCERCRSVTSDTSSQCLCSFCHSFLFSVIFPPTCDSVRSFLGTFFLLGPKLHLTKVLRSGFSCRKTIWKPTKLRTHICYHNTHVQAVSSKEHPKTWFLGWKNGRNTCVHANKSKQFLRDHGNVRLALTMNTD